MRKPAYVFADLDVDKYCARGIKATICPCIINHVPWIVSSVKAERHFRRKAAEPRIPFNVTEIPAQDPLRA